MRIGIIDTGTCNARSLEYAFKKLGVETGLVATDQDCTDYDRFVLPGVGSFDYAVESLHHRKLWDVVLRLALVEKKPILGICLGMQLFAESSEEGRHNGLGLIKGRVLKIRPDNEGIHKVPNIGWNYVKPVAKTFIEAYEHKLKSPRFYFVHSYHFDCADPANVALQVQIDKLYCAAVISQNIWGAQFHPEKSHNFGLEFLDLWMSN